MIEYYINEKTGEVDKTAIVYDSQLIFFLDADKISIYGVCKVGEDIIASTKRGWGKKTLNIFRDEVLNFIKTNQ